MNIFTLFKQWWKHRCEFAININGCLIPNCPHEPARIAARNPLPAVPPPGPPKLGMGRYYTESKWVSVEAKSLSLLVINDNQINIVGGGDITIVQKGNSLTITAA